MTKKSKDNTGTMDTSPRDAVEQEAIIMGLKHNLKIIKLELALVGKYYKSEEREEKEEMQKKLTDELLEFIEQSE